MHGEHIMFRFSTIRFSTTRLHMWWGARCCAGALLQAHPGRARRQVSSSTRLHIWGVGSTIRLHVQHRVPFYRPFLDERDAR